MCGAPLPNRAGLVSVATSHVNALESLLRFLPNAHSIFPDVHIATQETSCGEHL